MAYVRRARSTPGVVFERDVGVTTGDIQVPLALKSRKVGTEDMAWTSAALKDA